MTVCPLAIRFFPAIRPGKIGFRRRYTTSLTKWQSISPLPSSSISLFREQAFNPETPSTFPPGTFSSLPAISKWFTPLAADAAMTSTLDFDYLTSHGDPILPVELTSPNPNNDGSVQFIRGEQPLSNFLAWMKLRLQLPLSSESQTDADSSAAARAPSFYLAQSSLFLLSRSLLDDLPAPNLVLRAGKGDIYDSSLWIGVPPTVTPLHCDPNPNLLVQLAGEKVIRLMNPESGRKLLDQVKGRGGGMGNLRGVEMMQGEERLQLERAVWGGGEVADGEWEGDGEKRYEVKLGRGDGVFIPKGWWHAVKGIGQGGVSASVSTFHGFISKDDCHGAIWKFCGGEQ